MRGFRQAVLLLALVGTVAAQTGTFTDGRDGKTYKTAESTLADLIKRIPAGYRLFEEMHGDLNGDGVDDYVFIIKGTDKKNINNGIDRNRRGIMIFFSKGNDYKLVLENRQCFVSENENDSVYLSFEIKKGNLYINYEDNAPRYILRYTYTFRYRSSEFELIGYDYSDELSERSINFLSKKMVDRDRGGTGGKFKDTWTNLAIKEPILLRKIVKLEDYGYQTLDNYVK